MSDLRKELLKNKRRASYTDAKDRNLTLTRILKARAETTRRINEAKSWIEDVLQEKIMDDNDEYDPELTFSAALEDGTVLCRLMVAVEPGIIPKFHNRPKMNFLMIENINEFLTACSKLGMNNEMLFEAIDIAERRNITKIVGSIHSLGDYADVKGFKPAMIREGHKADSHMKEGWIFSQRQSGSTSVSSSPSTSTSDHSSIKKTASNLKRRISIVPQEIDMLKKAFKYLTVDDATTVDASTILSIFQDAVSDQFTPEQLQNLILGDGTLEGTLMRFEDFLGATEAIERETGVFPLYLGTSGHLEGVWILPRRMTPEEMNSLQEFYCTLPESGSISKQELDNILKRVVGNETQQETAKTLLSNIELGSNGGTSFENFLNGYAQIDPDSITFTTFALEEVESFRALFGVYDEDKTRKLSQDQLVNLLQTQLLREDNILPDVSQQVKRFENQSVNFVQFIRGVSFMDKSHVDGLLWNLENLQPELIQKLTDAFLKMDLNKDGQLSGVEVFEYLFEVVEEGGKLDPDSEWMLDQDGIEHTEIISLDLAELLKLRFCTKHKEDDPDAMSCKPQFVVDYARTLNHLTRLSLEEHRRREEDLLKKQQALALTEFNKKREEMRMRRELELREKQIEEEENRWKEEERKRLEILRKKLEEEERKRQLEEERRRQLEEERRKKEEELRKLAEESRRRQEEEARKLEAERKRIEEEFRRKAEEEKRRKEEEKRQREEEEHRRREEARRKLEEEQRRREEEERLQHEEEQRRREEEQRRIEEEKMRLEEELERRQREEEEAERWRLAELDRKWRMEEQLRREAEERQRAEEERLRREAERRRLAEEEKRKMEEEKRRLEEELRFQEEEQRRRMEAEAELRRLAEEERMRMEEEERQREEERLQFLLEQQRMIEEAERKRRELERLAEEQKKLEEDRRLALERQRREELERRRMMLEEQRRKNMTGTSKNRNKELKTMKISLEEQKRAALEAAEEERLRRLREQNAFAERKLREQEEKMMKQRMQEEASRKKFEAKFFQREQGLAEEEMNKRNERYRVETEYWSLFDFDEDGFPYLQEKSQTTTSKTKQTVSVINGSPKSPNSTLSPTSSRPNTGNSSNGTSKIVKKAISPSSRATTPTSPSLKPASPKLKTVVKKPVSPQRPL